ncbi:hypothetical protein [Chondromyces crocatus]|uniref:hypothetical protein n=1 Tax=Chondromyces crocatus TaxID=52 RepID=UPI00067E4ED5|nr:hypothetical protein [Chondromyces crocatus]
MTPSSPDQGEEREHDDEAALELPPLDADEEPAEQDEDLAALLDVPEDEGDPFDDAEARELPVDLPASVEEEAGGDREDEREVDVGPLDEGMSLDEEAGWSGEEGDGNADHGEEIDEVVAGDDDGGAEGTGEAPEDAVDESELPALDADDEGNYEGQDLLGELPDLPDDPPPSWDASPWAVIAGAGAEVPCATLDVASGRVVAGGSVLLVVPPGERVARRPGLDATAASVVLLDDALVVATRRGRLLESQDEGATATPMGAWRAGSGTPMSLARTPGRLWILSEGTLWSLTAGGSAAVPVVTGSREGGVVRIAASGGALFALWKARGAAQLQRLRGDDEGPVEVPLAGAAQHAASAREVVIAAGAQGKALAVASAEVLCVSRDGGATFQSVGGLGRVVAMAFAGASESAPLLAVCAREGEAQAELVRIPAVGAATRIATLGARRSGDEDDAPGASGAAMAWDAGREVVWIACQFGLLAVAAKQEH